MAGMLAATLIASAGRCWSEDSYKPISEEALRTASAQMYSSILAQQCLQGRRYPQSRIANGFKRHFEEMRLQMVAGGYSIVPDLKESNPVLALSQMAFDAKRRLGLRRQFGCLAAYWLDNDRDW